jgi:hypothetical protein
MEWNPLLKRTQSWAKNCPEILGRFLCAVERLLRHSVLAPVRLLCSQITNGIHRRALVPKSGHLIRKSEYGLIVKRHGLPFSLRLRLPLNI